LSTPTNALSIREPSNPKGLHRGIIHNSSSPQVSLCRALAESLVNTSSFNSILSVTVSSSKQASLSNLRGESESRKSQQRWANKLVDIKGIQTQLSPYPSSTSSSPTTTEAPPALVLPPGTTDIVAGATHFACLAAGLVYTWGDPRHTAPLGRLSPSTSRLDSCSASLPALVTDLSELAEGLSLASPNGENDIFKIAAGGYTTAALTVTGDCYIWGDRSQGWTSTPEPVDMEVRDVAVGEEFVVLLDGKGRVWVRGKGASGELGLGVGREEAREWTRVPVDLEEGKMVRGVVAGPRCCLLLVDIPAEEETESEEEGRGGGFGKEGSGADEEIED